MRSALPSSSAPDADSDLHLFGPPRGENRRQPVSLFAVPGDQHIAEAPGDGAVDRVAAPQAMLSGEIGGLSSQPPVESNGNQVGQVAHGAGEVTAQLRVVAGAGDRSGDLGKEQGRNDQGDRLFLHPGEQTVTRLVTFFVVLKRVDEDTGIDGVGRHGRQRLAPHLRNQLR